MKLEEKIYAKITSEAKKPNPKDHTTLTPKEMEDVIRKAQKLKKASLDKKAKKSVPPEEYRKVKSPSDTFQIVAPKTAEASCHYGSGTKWCTAAKGNNFFDQYYNQKGITLYYLLPKSVDAGRAGDMSDEEVADFHAQLDDLFEGKLEDLKKKYPQWVLPDYADWNKTYSGPRGIDKMSQEDPSGKNKYLAWMVKNANDIVVLDDDGKVSGRREMFARNRVINLIKYYHELLPFIGREEKPGKEKTPEKKKSRSRFDKVAIVVHPDQPMQIFDAEDKEHDTDFLKDALKAFGVEEDKVEATVDMLLDAIDDDNEENPNPVGARVAKIEAAVNALEKKLEDEYSEKHVLNFFKDPEKYSDEAVAYGKINITHVSPGRLVLPFTTLVYMPIPDQIGGYEKLYKDEVFRGNDRGRLDNFRDYIKQNMNTDEYPKEIGELVLKSFNVTKEKYEKELAAKASLGSLKARSYINHVSNVGRADKQMFTMFDMPATVMIKNTSGIIPDQEIDQLQLDVISDLKQFMEQDINTVRDKAWKNFKRLAAKWMKENPRKSPEEEKKETEASVDAIMSHLPEEKAMKLEERILVKLLGEDLLQEVTLADAMNSLKGKAGQKLVKSYNFDRGVDPEDNMRILHDTLVRAIERTLTPSDVVPGNISQQESPEKYKSVQDSNRGQIVYWWLRYLKKNKDARDKILGSQYLMSNRDLMLVRQNFETFFQHPRHMSINDIGKIDSKEKLNDIVAAAKKSIDAENDRKMANDAVGRTEFFAGAYKLDDKGDVVRDEEGIPQFRKSKDGWVIAAAHGKGAACLLGKKTSWCTASPGLDYFKTYYGGEDDPLFYIHTPAETLGGEYRDGDRFQFHYGSKQFMDVTDTPVRGAEFETLHNKLKDVLRDNGFEDRFDIVFDYEMIDYEERLRELVEATEQRLDNGNRISIAADTYDDYEDAAINFEAIITFIYDRGEWGDLGKEDLDMYDEEAIVELFNSTNGFVNVGLQGDPDDLSQYIDVNVSGRTVKITFECIGSSYGEGGLEEAEDFFNNVVYGPDNKYEECKGKVRAGLIEFGILPLTKYDKLLYGQGDDAEVQKYDPEDDGREVEDKTARELQEEFEEQYKNLHLISFDPDNGSMEFSIPYPPPKDVQADKTQIIGDRPSNDGAQKIFRRGLKVFQKLLQRQPSLPGMEEQDTDDIIDRVMYVAERNDLVGYMIVYKTTAKLDIELAFSSLSEEELDAVVNATKLFDKHWKLWQASLQSATERWIEMNPQRIRRDNNFDPDRKLAGVQTGEPVGATLGAPQPAQEAKDYQKSPAKGKKHVVMKKRLIKTGGNKHKEKGMKEPPTKRSKSAPPGMGA